MIDKWMDALAWVCLLLVLGMLVLGILMDAPVPEPKPVYIGW